MPNVFRIVRMGGDDGTGKPAVTLEVEHEPNGRCVALWCRNKTTQPTWGEIIRVDTGLRVGGRFGSGDSYIALSTTPQERMDLVTDERGRITSVDFDLIYPYF